MNERPQSPSLAALTALDLVGHGIYQLGTGDCDTRADEPTDCAGFAICKAYGLRRHRPGYNVGSWATVTGDLNSNAIIEDARHARELFAPVTGKPRIGDLVAYPTIRIKGADGLTHVFVGHVAIVVNVGRVLEWDPAFPSYASLDIAQCIGPDGRKPGIVASDASHFSHHDAQWPRDDHRTWLLRAVP